MNVVSPSKSQENTTPRGVNYFKQFPRNLLVPYGSSLEQKLIKYLQPFNCELLLQPSVFFSEFCSSISQCLQEVQEEVINVNGLAHGSGNMRDFITYMEHLKELVLPLSRDAGEPPSKPQVISVLHSLVSNDDEGEEMINRAFSLGNALFSMACHCVASRVLLRNPSGFSARVSSLSGADLEFKRNPSVRTMSEFIVNECLKKTAIASLIDRTEITSQFSDLLQEGVEAPITPKKASTSSTSTSSPRGKSPASASKGVKSAKTSVSCRQETSDDNDSDDSDESPPASQRHLQLHKEKKRKDSSSRREKSAKAAKNLFGLEAIAADADPSVSWSPSRRGLSCDSGPADFPRPKKDKKEKRKHK